MFNQRLLKSFLVGSWLLVIYAATPWSPDSTKWLAGAVLGMSYVLCGVIFGSTDQEALMVVKGVKTEAERLQAGQSAWFIEQMGRINDAVEKCKSETMRVSKAISEMRSFQQ